MCAIYFFHKTESALNRTILEYWKEDDKLFVSTKACEKVENLIKKENLVIVVGHSGSGKSAIIKNIALKYRQQKWVVKPVTKVEQISSAFVENEVSENKTLFVFDDPIGKESYDEKTYGEWKINEELLKACLKKIKLLVSCRKCVLSDERAKGLFKNISNIVDIDEDDCKLSGNEKLNIWNNYNSNSISLEIDLTKLIEIDAYFPLLCKLFFSDIENQKKGLQFFKQPEKVYKEEIEYFKTSSKEKYCALVLLVLCNNKLYASKLNEGESKQMYKRALELCGLNDCTPPPTIVDALKTMTGFYVREIENYYQFCHDFLMEVTSRVFGKDYPKAMIEYADIGFLRKRVKLEGCNDQNYLNAIYISNTDLDSLADRLLKEIVGKRLLDAVLNPCLKDKKVAGAMIKNIEKQRNKIIELI